MDKSSQLPKTVILQVVVAFVAVAVTIAAALQLSPLIEKKEQLSKEVSDKQKELQAYSTQIDVLRAQKDRLTHDIRLGQISSIEALITPRADVEEFSAAEAAKQPKGFKRFSMWLEVPPDRQDDIARVTYFLNHPSFGTPLMEGDAKNSFRASYNGWGCLSNVIITVTVKDGEEKELDFDQCAAIRDNE